MMTDLTTVDRELSLTVSGVTLGYQGITALTDISFQVRAGEFVGIIGPNGSGKSTLLKGILGLVPLRSGVIRFDQAGTESFRKGIGYVPQKNKNDLHFPAIVREVVLMGLYAQLGWFKWPGEVQNQKVNQTLEMVGIGDLADRPIRGLSGGQQQRVMIARALVGDPWLLVLDEPTAAIDITAQHMILELLEELNRERGMTILMVSHDINEIVHFCDKVLLLNGKVCGFGSPSAVLTKENLKPIYGDRILVYDHQGHPHLVVGDFHA